MEWMLMPLRRYAEFSGRSRRKEYWMFVLFMIIVGVVLGFVEGLMGLNTMIAGIYGPLTALFILGTLVPGIAVGVRRLHDTNRSGWWLLLVYGPYAILAYALATQNTSLMGIFSLVVLVGAIVLLIFLVLDGTRGTNRFGPDPKGQADPEVFA